MCTLSIHHVQWWLPSLQPLHMYTMCMHVTHIHIHGTSHNFLETCWQCTLLVVTKWQAQWYFHLYYVSATNTNVFPGWMVTGTVHVRTCISQGKRTYMYMWKLAIRAAALDVLNSNNLVSTSYDMSLVYVHFKTVLQFNPCVLLAGKQHVCLFSLLL